MVEAALVVVLGVVEEWTPSHIGKYGPGVREENDTVSSQLPKLDVGTKRGEKRTRSVPSSPASPHGDVRDVSSETTGFRPWAGCCWLWSGGCR